MMNAKQPFVSDCLCNYIIFIFNFNLFSNWGGGGGEPPHEMHERA